jgi:cephalosporin hydroxylase
MELLQSINLKKNKTMTIQELQTLWKDDKESHKYIAETLAHKTNEIPELKAHRDYVETNSFGFGERPFVFMHKLLVDEMPSEFTFMEIGIYKGAILSLYKMLANMAGKTVNRYGVSPMSTAGNFPESDFEKDVDTIHDEFKLEKDFIIIKGLSTDPIMIKAAGYLVPIHILYIDGGHDFETVFSDIKNYSPLIVSGGFLIVDDACNEMDLPDGYFGGIQSVTDAVLAFPLPNEEFKFLFSVGHNKVFLKR